MWKLLPIILNKPVDRCQLLRYCQNLEQKSTYSKNVLFLDLLNPFFSQLLERQSHGHLLSFFLYKKRCENHVIILRLKYFLLENVFWCSYFLHLGWEMFSCFWFYVWSVKIISLVLSWANEVGRPKVRFWKETTQPSTSKMCFLLHVVRVCFKLGLTQQRQTKCI